MKLFSLIQIGAAALGLSSCVPVPVGHGGYGHHGYGHGGGHGYGGRPVLVPTGRQVLVPAGYGHGYGGYGYDGYGYGGSRGIQPCDPRYYQPGRQYYYQPPPVTIPSHRYGGGYGHRPW